MKLGVLEACNSSDNIVKITNDSYLPNYDDLKKQIDWESKGQKSTHVIKPNNVLVLNEELNWRFCQKKKKQHINQSNTFF